jgi:hypothetical protein
MIITKWLQNLFRGNSTTIALPEASQKGRITGPKPLLDVAQEALRQEAANLQGLVTHGAASMREKELRKKVRAKVAKVIDPVFSNPDIIEEVTERITLAATVDPHYQNLIEAFEAEEKKT